MLINKDWFRRKYMHTRKLNFNLVSEKSVQWILIWMPAGICDYDYRMTFHIEKRLIQADFASSSTLYCYRHLMSFLEAKSFNVFFVWVPNLCLNVPIYDLFFMSSLKLSAKNEARQSPFMGNLLQYVPTFNKFPSII